MVNIPEAIEWLKADTQNQLIVILPLDERNRNTIEKSLIDDRDRCI
jgi:hypothetical protein